MTRKTAILYLCLFSNLAFLNAIEAAGSNDPDWPCVQRKVSEISIGQMWNLPVSEQNELSKEEAKLAQWLGLRKIDEAHAQSLVEEFSKTHKGTSPEHYGAIYKTVLSEINTQRARLIEGIKRYAHGQKARAEHIDQLRAQMRELEAKQDPDFDQIDTIEETLDWEERIFKDRQSSLQYVCETPVLLEKRAYWVARLLEAHAKPQ